MLPSLRSHWHDLSMHLAVFQTLKVFCSEPLQREQGNGPRGEAKVTYTAEV